MNKIIFCLGIIGYSTLLWGMDPSISSGSSDLVPVRSISPSQSGNNQEQGQDRFFLIVQTLDGNEKRIDWKKLIPLSSVQNSEPEPHPYNQQLKDVAERGFNRMIKEDCLDFTEWEKIVLEKRLQPIIANFEELRSINKQLSDENSQLVEQLQKQKDIYLRKGIMVDQTLLENYTKNLSHNRQLSDENNQLRALLEQMALAVRLEVQDLKELMELLKKEPSVVAPLEMTVQVPEFEVQSYQQLSDENDQLRASLLKHMTQAARLEGQNLMEVSQHVAIVSEDDQALVCSKQLLDENNQLQALVESLQQKIAEFEVQNNAKTLQQLEGKKDFKFERMYEEFKELSNRRFVVAPRLQNKSRLRLFCALFVTGGMLWGLKYFFNK